MLGIFGIILSLVLLMYLAYRGINVIFLAPAMALLAVLFHPGEPILAFYTQIFMPALGKYILLYFPIFLLGSVFGKFMADSGAASVLGAWVARVVGPQHAILAVILACALLTFGGVSLFVVAFCVYPISLSLYERANLPRKLIPGAIAVGSFTFTMTALPGTPAIQNAIPMPYFGTTAYAAPGLGIIGALVMFLGGLLWMKHQEKKCRARGEVFTPDLRNVIDEKSQTPLAVWKALTPLVVVVILNYLFSHYWIANWETGFLSEQRFGATELSKVLGMWSLIAAVALGLVVLFGLTIKQLKSPITTLNEGSLGSLLPIFNTATEVGYGAVIAALPSFAILKNSVLGIFPSNPLISEAIAINALAGITGSASGGLSIALETLGKSYLEMAQALNISPELLHRVASMSSGGFDTLPHNGAVITLLSICALTHKDSYKDIFVVAVAVPVIATAVVITFGTAFGSF